MAQVKVTLVKSVASRPADQRATVVALGLHKTNSTVIKEATPLFCHLTAPPSQIHPSDQRHAS